MGLQPGLRGFVRDADVSGSHDAGSVLEPRERFAPSARLQADGTSAAVVAGALVLLHGDRGRFCVSDEHRIALAYARLTAWSIIPLSFSTTGAGVFLGATSPTHM